jgi:DHA1 family multidrug resistance protein-like MFS transporter
MGVNNAFLSLGRIAGPLWAGLVYDIQLNLPYFSGALIMLVGYGIAMLRLKTEPSPAIESLE